MQPRENKIRIIYIIISIIVIIFSYHYENKLIENQSIFNVVSYIGIVATIIGLLITICEVIHNVSISKSIQHEAKQLIDQIRNIDCASLVSESVALLDEANNYISNEQYQLSLRNIQFFSRNYTRMNAIGIKSNNIDNTMTQLELEIQKATHTKPSSPLPKPKRTKIQSDIINLKNELLTANKKRGENVSR